MSFIDIPAQILDVTFSDMGFIVFLQPENQRDESVAVPIFIGIPEAQSIAIQFNKIRSPRPLIMDLIFNMMNLLKVKISKVLISDLVDKTFYGKIYMEDQNGSFYKLDARSSDAVILALRFNAPIFIRSTIIEEAGILIRKENFSEKKETVKPTKLKTRLETIEDELKKAIEEERYEEAARLRDEVRKMKGESN
ncbi:MAG TPA: bifunctional nuclease [Spirochaetia bacterium]|nr:bifunctional nuclease [Spirochaetia bacterium]